MRPRYFTSLSSCLGSKAAQVASLLSVCFISTQGCRDYIVYHVMVSSYMASEQKDKYYRKIPKKTHNSNHCFYINRCWLVENKQCCSEGDNVTRDDSAYTLCCSETWNKQAGEKQKHPRHAAVVCFHSSESSCAQAACFKTVSNDKYTGKTIWQKC